MAVTRILNNQITNAISGNTYVGIDAGLKLQDFTVTGAKLANGLIYSSDLSITGNVTGGN